MYTVLIIFVLVLVCWPWLSKLFSRLMQWVLQRSAEKMMRKMMGMPSQREYEKQRKRAEERERKQRKAEERAEEQRRRSGRRRHPAPRYRAAMLLRSVAVDVEYVEIHEFHQTVIAGGEGPASIIYEEQLSEAEYTEIRR